MQLRAFKAYLLCHLYTLQPASSLMTLMNSKHTCHSRHSNIDLSGTEPLRGDKVYIMRVLKDD